MSKKPLHLGHRMLVARSSRRARSRQLGQTPYRAPQVSGSRAERAGRGTTVQRVGGVGRISSVGRGNAFRVPLISSTASTDVSRITRYHAPRRRWPASEGRSRAHCPIAMGPPRLFRQGPGTIRYTAPFNVKMYNSPFTSCPNELTLPDGCNDGPAVAGACRNRTYRGPLEPQTVLKTGQATRPNPLPRRCRAYGVTAITSISTRAALGSPAACTVDRAGLCAPKCLAYTSFICAKSAMSARYTVVFTTFASDVPAADSTAFRFANTCSVCSAVVLPTSSPLFGSSATCPAVKTRPSIAIAWL